MIGLQMSIPELTAHMSQGRVAIGTAGENMVAKAFEESGYHVRTAYSNGDLHVINKSGELFYVEVKTSRKGVDGRWRFTLFKKGSQTHHYANFVVLLCVMKSGFSIPFVIPIEHCRDVNSITIPTYPGHYQGKYATFRQSLKKLRLPQ